MQQFDIVVIGSGLGGLLSAVLLAKEGMHVAVIEQNKQVGGCLQTFSFDKKVFDSCVHYIGALDEGQTQERIFKYAGISDSLNFKRLDVDGFDKIIFGEEQTEYPQAQGLANFREQLAPYFTNVADLKLYTNSLQEVGDSFPLYNLRNGSGIEKDKVSHWNMQRVMNQINDDKLLHVLTGNNLLYAGQESTTPFYVHGLVTKSYIDSAYKCEGRSSQIAKLLWRKLQEYGGVVYRNEKVNQLIEEDGKISKAITENGNEYGAKNFIANVHPAMVLDWMDSKLIRPAYRKRITTIENSISAFMVNIVLKPQTVTHKNHNIYWNKTADTYRAYNYQREGWPENYALYFGEDSQHQGFSDTVAILTYMHATEFEQWQSTRNITAKPSEREIAYHQFKEERASKLISVVAQRYPELQEHIYSMKIATPLTFRDYMGSPDGSMYGLMADVNNQAFTQVPVRTKVPNLLLTGQNIGLHGVLGVSINAIAACGELVGLDYLLNKINNS